MDNNSKPSINNMNNNNNDQSPPESKKTEHVGPNMVDDAPDILRSDGSRSAKVESGKQTQTSKQFTQTPPPNYQPQQGYQAPPEQQSQSGDQTSSNQQPGPGNQAPPNQQSQPGYQAPPNYQYQQGYYAPPYYTYQQKKGGWKKGLLIFGIILVVVIFLGYQINNFYDSLFESEPAYEVPNDDYIARIDVIGEITAAVDDSYLSSGTGYNHQFTLDSLDEITNDDNNVALLLYVDTPGGGVYESDQIYLKIKEYQDKTKRPVYVAMGSMAASGGYYISANADKIIADRNCWTGSIGVTMGTYYDISGLLKQYGIKAENLTSGPNKAMGSMVEPLTKEQRNIYKGLIDDAYNQFVGLIAEGRSMDLNTVKTLGDGRIYTANQAKANGLIDEIATVDEAIEILKKENDFDCEVVRFEDYSSSWVDEFFYTKIVPALNKLKSLGSGDLEKALELIEGDDKIPLKYMYEQ